LYLSISKLSIPLSHPNHCLESLILHVYAGAVSAFSGFHIPGNAERCEGAELLSPTNEWERMGFYQPKLVIFLRKPWKTMRFNHDGPCRLAAVWDVWVGLLNSSKLLLDVIYRENHP